MERVFFAVKPLCESKKIKHDFNELITFSFHLDIEANLYLEDVLL